MFLLLSAAHAQVFIELTDPGLQDAVFVESLRARDARATQFFAFLGNGIVEQGFALRHQPELGTAALSGCKGLSLGVSVNTFPFTPPQKNLIGKEENTGFSPVLPRLHAAFRGGDDTRSWGIGWSLTPPIEVEGASALIGGVDASYGVDVGEKFRLGAELRGTIGRAVAPVTATPDQQAAGDLGNTDPDRYATVCATQPFGCTDVLTLARVGAHGVVEWRVHPQVHPYARLGAEYLSDTFYVQVDASGWRVWGVLPDLGVGASILPHGWLGANVGATTAWVPKEVATADRTPLVYRFDASAVVRF